MLGDEHREVKLGDGLELEHKHLHHLDQQLLAIASLLLRSESDSVDQVQQQLAAHGLDTGG